MEIEDFKRATHQTRMFVGNSRGQYWNFQARLKFSSEIEYFKRKLKIFERSSEIDFFLDSGPLGSLRTREAQFSEDWQLACSCQRGAAFSLPSLPLSWPSRHLSWAAPTVSYGNLWPTRTELSRKIGNSLAETLLWFVPEVAASRKIRSPHVLQRKSFHTSHFCDLYRSCAGPEIISEAPSFDFLIFCSKNLLRLILGDSLKRFK